MCYLFDFYPITYTQVIRYSRACRNYRTLLFDGQDSDAKTTQTGSMLCRIVVIPSQVLWPSSRIDWPLWDVLCPKWQWTLAGAPAVTPVFLGVRVYHLFFSFLVFDVQCLFMSCVFLVPGFIFVHFHIQTRYKTLWKKVL